MKMNIDINNVQIETFKEINNEIEEVIRNLKVIFSTPEGTVPFDRSFGIDFSIIDQPLEKAKNMLTVEFIKKTKRFEPRAKVVEVTYNHNGIDGAIIPKVVIEIES